MLIEDMTKGNAFVFFCLTHTAEITDQTKVGCLSLIVIGLKVAVSCGFAVARLQLVCYPQMFQGSLKLLNISQELTALFLQIILFVTATMQLNNSCCCH